jgi:hypothetical protein
MIPLCNALINMVWVCDSHKMDFNIIQASFNIVVLHSSLRSPHRPCQPLRSQIARTGHGRRGMQSAASDPVI